VLDHAGHAVTREELQNLLWPVGVLVDYDHGLNKAINKLRTILGDDASKPRYIETLSRRGYRFIGEVKWILWTARLVGRSRHLQSHIIHRGRSGIFALMPFSL
jgi:DNA-binding winged helix-turn-helix (wHTH) protein